MITSLVPLSLPGSEIERIRTLPGKLLIWAHAIQVETICPDGGQASRRIHSRYRRLVQDLPVRDQAVDLPLQVRRLRCRTPTCPRHTFVAQHPELVVRYARRTVGLSRSLLHLGRALGGAAGARRWKVALHQFADTSQLGIEVCHFPPGTRKWNKIEHRMSCHIRQNWRGRPLTCRAVVVNLISQTTTSTGLTIRAALDETLYPAGTKGSAEQFASLALERDPFYGEWNYILAPRLSP